MEGVRASIDVPFLGNVEEVANPLPLKQDANNHTSLPSDCKSWNEYDDWCTYENTEFRQHENFKECWGDVDNLKEKFGTVYLVNINYGDRIRPEEGADRHAFGFDFAIAGADEYQRRKIKRFADDYRNIGSDGNWTTNRAVKAIIPLMKLIKSMQYVESHFS